MDAKTPEHTVSGGNVFADLGLPSAEELQVRAALANQIASIVASKHIGSGFDALLRDEDLLNDARAAAAGRVTAFQITREMETTGISRPELERRRKTRAHRGRALPPQDPSRACRPAALRVRDQRPYRHHLGCAATVGRCRRPYA